MSPEPWIRVQAGALGALFFVSTLFGHWLGVVITAGVTAMLVAYLVSMYHLALYRHRTQQAFPERYRLDAVVYRDAVASLGIGATAGVLSLILDQQPLDVRISSAVVIPLLVVMEAIYVSSLVDWFVILPRMSGLLGYRPCRDRHERFKVFPTTWKEVTRVWLWHRAVVALVIRYGLACVISAIVSEAVGLGAAATLVSTAILGGLASYTQASVFALFMRPRMSVGQTVIQPEYKNKKFTVPVLNCKVAFLPFYTRTEDPDRRRYVYDVAMEGYQLVPVESYEQEGEPREHFQGDSGEIVPLRKAMMGPGATEPVREFGGCDGNRCSKINWYCIENPRCFETKTGD